MNLIDSSLVKIAPKEKSEEEKLWEISVKSHTILSSAFRLISEEYPEKFGDKISGSFDGNKTITLTGDLDVFKTESYDRFVECDGQKVNYIIILRKK